MKGFSEARKPQIERAFAYALNSAGIDPKGVSVDGMSFNPKTRYLTYRQIEKISEDSAFVRTHKRKVKLGITQALVLLSTIEGEGSLEDKIHDS